MATLAELESDLAGIQAAIANLEGRADEVPIATQEFWDGGDRWLGVNAATLYEERARLRKQIDLIRATGGEGGHLPVSRIRVRQ